MIIVVDKDGQQAIEGLCDTFLKAGGINALQSSLQILQSVQMVDRYTDDIRNKVCAEIKERDGTLKCEAGEVEI